MNEGSVWLFLAALAASLPATIAAIAALIATIRNSRQIQKVEHNTNALVASLVKTAGDLGHAKGVTAGEEAERGREKK